MATNAVEKSESKVPDLVRAQHSITSELTSEDVALPTIKIGQYMSDAVKEQLVKAGSIFTATSKDDPDPQLLAEPDSKDGVVVHVLALRKGKSLSVDGELVLFDYDDPSAPDDAWVTYNYTVALPAVDDQVPFKWLLTRTGRPAAKQINTVLVKNEARGPAYANAFRFTTAMRENAKGKFFVPRVAPIEAVTEHVEVAEKLAVMIAGATSDFGSKGSEPSI